MTTFYRLRDVRGLNQTVGYAIQLDSGTVWVGIWMDPKKPVLGGSYTPMLGRFLTFEDADRTCKKQYRGISLELDDVSFPAETERESFKYCMSYHWQEYSQNATSYAEYEELSDLLASSVLRPSFGQDRVIHTIGGEVQQGWGDWAVPLPPYGHPDF